MPDYAYRVYESIVDSTSSELILFFVIVAVVLAIVIVPLYTIVMKDRRDRRKGDVEVETVKHNKYLERESKFIERERLILDVIKENTVAISKLNVTLENNGETTKATLERIHIRVDDLNEGQTDIKTDVAQLKVKFENFLNNQIEMASKINKILLISDKLQ